MTASHPGGPGASPPDILASGSWGGHNDRPADLTAARRRVAAIAAVAVVLAAGWAGRDYLTGSWRYWAEHRSPLTPGLLCPTFPGHAMPGPGLLTAIADLGRGIPSGAVARQYGCKPASSIFGSQGRAPLRRGARLKLARAPAGRQQAAHKPRCKAARPSCTAGLAQITRSRPARPHCAGNPAAAPNGGPASAVDDLLRHAA